MKRTAVITGAGSGVGRAVAMALAKADWNVALIGRTRATLEETATGSLWGRGIAAANLQTLVVPCDIGNVDQVNAMAEAVLEKFGSVDVLVNAAGTNVPVRALEVLSLEDYHAMMDANLNGP